MPVNADSKKALLNYKRRRCNDYTNDDSNVINQHRVWNHNDYYNGTTTLGNGTTP
jgi:hypothetical protein